MQIYFIILMSKLHTSDQRQRQWEVSCGGGWGVALLGMSVLWSQIITKVFFFIPKYANCYIRDWIGTRQWKLLDSNHFVSNPWCSTVVMFNILHSVWVKGLSLFVYLHWSPLSWWCSSGSFVRHLLPSCQKKHSLHLSSTVCSTWKQNVNIIYWSSFTMTVGRWPSLVWSLTPLVSWNPVLIKEIMLLATATDSTKQLFASLAFSHPIQSLETFLKNTLNIFI